MAATDQVETPSGKWAGDENFPVGSLLLPSSMRPTVMAYYAFARQIDDIADNTALSADEKIERLDRMGSGVRGESPDDPTVSTATRCHRAMTAAGLPLDHCLDLIIAFKQDAVKLRYDDWSDLMGYCRYSASPVGRFLLDLHEEDRDGYSFSDPLCNALQVLNHLQDCKDDFCEMNRVYLPRDWMAAHNVTVEELDNPDSSPGLRAVIDLCLDGAESLLTKANQLPSALRSHRLAMESATIIEIAWRLAHHLRRRDPVRERVELSKSAAAVCFAKGIRWAWFGTPTNRKSN